MDNENSYETMIIIGNGNKRRAYAIPHIVDVRQKEKVVELTLSAPFNTEMPDISFDSEALATKYFYDCLAKIEAYYQAMMPRNSGCSCKDK